MATGTSKSSKSARFLRSVFERFKAMQKSSEFCDINIVVKGTVFPVHRVILMAASDKFRKLCNDIPKEQTDQQIEIENFEPETVSLVIEYVYSGQLRLNDENIVEVLRLCDYLKLERARQACCDYILSHGSAENCVQTYLLGSTYGVPEIVKFAEELILFHLKEVVASEQFLKLSIGHLEKILSKTIAKNCAGQMYFLIIRWVKHDLENRRQFLLRLLRTLPTDDLPVQFFVSHMETESLLHEDVDCANWLMVRLNEKCSGIVQNTEFLSNSAFISNRIGNDLTTYKLNVDTQTYQNLALRPDISLFTTAYFQNSVYLTGGQTNENVKPCVVSYKYDRQENAWTNIDFKFPKVQAGSAVLNDRWYVIGGSEVCFPTDTAVVYDFYSGKCVNLPKMNNRKKLPGVATYNGSLYVCCGYSGRRDLNFIERYDPRQGEWSQVCTFTKLNGACSATVIGDYLYCLRCYTREIEKLDLRSYDSEVWPAKEVGDYIAAVGGNLLVGHKEGVMKYDKGDWQHVCSMSLNEPVIISCE